MCNILCVTNRTLCGGDFIERIEKIAACRPAGIILREKDLSADEYKILAAQAMEICGKYNVPCIMHSFVDIALQLEAESIHLPLPVLRQMSEEKKARLKKIGASCHSVEDALEAERLGCAYITAGHVFATDCKKGLPPRGPAFLKNVCDSVNIPVYAIGGISAGNFADVIAAGAKGACVMSGLMRCDAPAGFMDEFCAAVK